MLTKIEIFFENEWMTMIMKKKSFLIKVAVAAAVLGAQSLAASPDRIKESSKIDAPEVVQFEELIMVKSDTSSSDMKLAGHSSHSSHASHGSHGSHSSHSSGF